MFGKSEADLLVDASVRVYVHRLRKKLDDYYNGEGKAEAQRLTLPKGDYRFRLAAPEEVEPVEELAVVLPELGWGWRRPAVWLFAALGLILGVALTLATLHDWRGDDQLAAVRASAVWSPFIASKRTLTIVAGDYYIMGRARQAGAPSPRDCVREYAVNSREDLDALLMDKPELRDKLVDLNLYYLPVSTAYALRSIMPIVTPGLAGRTAVPVVPASKLMPADFKTGDIVYVGLMSGLACCSKRSSPIRASIMRGSFDELIDTKTGKVYVADPPQDGETARRNYAYVAMLPGPGGNHILIIAGTRDPRCCRRPTIMNSPALLKTLQAAGKDGYFEALFAVDGVGDQNLRGTLIAAGPRSIEGMWDGVDGVTPSTAPPPAN